MNVMTFFPTFEDAPRMLERLRMAQFDLNPVQDVSEALEAVRRLPYHALVVEGRPDSSELIREVRRNSQGYVYSIALLSSEADQRALQGLADEVLWLPCEPDELIARLAVVERYLHVLQSLRGGERELEPVRDVNTGAFTASSIRELLEAELQRSRRNGRAFTVVLGEVRMANGDALPADVLERALAHCVMKVWASVRAYDLIGLWGKNRLLIILPETTAGAVVVLNRIRRHVESVPLHLDENRQLPLRFTMVAAQTQPEALQSADAVLNNLEQDLQRLVAAE